MMHARCAYTVLTRRGLEKYMYAAYVTCADDDCAGDDDDNCAYVNDATLHACKVRIQV